MINRLLSLRFVLPLSLPSSISRLLALGYILMSFCIQGQPGSLDLTFNTGSGANDRVRSITLQPNGKILIVGNFTFFNGINVNNILRLHIDGTMDDTFNTGTGANDFINSIAIQPDGKILIGGNFTFFNGVYARRIARLNADGTLDDTFDTGTGASGAIRSIALQPDGRILIVGSFMNFNGNSMNRIARLNADGTLDDTFDTGTGASGVVETIALQPDGKVLIGGIFTSFNETSAVRIAHLNANGTFDDTFITGTGASDWVESIVLQPDGKILIGGDFISFNGVPAGYILRLNPDGTIDDTFITGIWPNDWVWSIVLQPNGKFLIAGWFTFINGTPTTRIARMNPDGTLDSSFNTGTGANDFVRPMALQPDGKILIGGSFESFNGTTANRIARLHGDVDTHISEHKSEHSLTVYPNPFKHQVEILTADNFSGNNYRWDVMDATGRVLMPRESLRTNERLILNFEGMTDGIYLIRLTDGERSYTTRVVKE